MRSVDRPVPTINDDRPAVEPFPAVLHIGIDRQPVAVHVWDDATWTWDQPGIVWDATAAESFDRFDLWCDFYGLTIVAGGPDSEGLFASGSVEMTLDNRDGSLSAYDAAGRLVDWQLGSPLDIWAIYAGEEFWLFSGRITAWREMVDGTLEVEAFDAFSELNQFLGMWTPGVAGQNVAQRLTSICTRVGFTGPTRFDEGQVTLLTVPVEDRTALEMMQAAASSDGGALFCDADGTVVYEPRAWFTGRADQPTVPVLSDNHCEATSPVWDAVMLTFDDTLVNIATLANVADPVIEVSARNEESIQRHRAHTLPSARREDLWSTVGEGEELAIWTVSARGEPFVHLEQVLLYLHDRRFDLWPIGLDVRIGDLVEWIHEQPAVDGTQIIALTLAVQRIIHDITPESWITTIATTRAIDHREFQHWDRTVFTWDDTDARNIWAI